MCMYDYEFCCFRLRKNISVSENGKIYLSDIQKKLHGQFTSRAIALAMKNEFKGFIVKVVRNKEHWAKLTRLYMGVEWKQKSCNPPLANKTCESSSECVLLDHLYAKTSQTIPPEKSKSKAVDYIPISISSKLDHSYIKLVKSDHQDLTKVLENVTSSKMI